MEAKPVDLKALFDRDVRYLVPVFQRNYKWNRLEHWQPLWIDFRNLAADLLEFGPGPDLSEHFLGAIVCEQQQSIGRDVLAVSVIDGQQRLTSLQLFLAALRDVCSQRDFDADVEYLTPFVENKPHLVSGRDEHRFKIWPNVADRTAFLAALDGDTGTSRPQQARQFFEERIARWIEVGDEDDPEDDEDNTPAERMSALIDAVSTQVKIVKIDLEPKDNAQVIFETLNGRGEKLTDADLIRNYLFRRADDEGIDIEDLHARTWADFDHERWAAEVTHGRHQRDRLHLFLNHWLSMRQLAEVPASSLFRQFQAMVEKQGLAAETVAKELQSTAAVFDSFDHFPDDSIEQRFFRRVQEMDLITVFPLILWTYSQTDANLSTERKTRIIRAVESYLVRRLLGRRTTRSYGSVFIDLLAAAGDGPPGDADARVVSLLASRTADADVWPSDEQLATDVRTLNFYGSRKSRIVMVFEAIERQLLTSGKTETVNIGRKSVEHVLPQGWRAEPGWALPTDLEDPTKAGLERDRLLNTLGNLTVVTWGKNSELSNRPWTDKRARLSKDTSLQLNRDLATRWPNEWNETTIDDRAGYLLTQIRALWPSPDSFLIELDGRAVANHLPESLAVGSTAGPGESDLS